VVERADPNRKLVMKRVRIDVYSGEIEVSTLDNYLNDGVSSVSSYMGKGVAKV